MLRFRSDPPADSPPYRLLADLSASSLQSLYENPSRSSGRTHKSKSKSKSSSLDGSYRLSDVKTALSSFDPLMSSALGSKTSPVLTVTFPLFDTSLISEGSVARKVVLLLEWFVLPRSGWKGAPRAIRPTRTDSPHANDPPQRKHGEARGNGRECRIPRCRSPREGVKARAAEALRMATVPGIISMEQIFIFHILEATRRFSLRDDTLSSVTS
mmetsp:Transcript_3174/g.6560  ORF Transcript_3174/g.6560 Transcript_3174/m.6560 type:complete len:213 (+) Transcript_3174:1215-1853(+)